MSESLVLYRINELKVKHHPPFQQHQGPRIISKILVEYERINWAPSRGTSLLLLTQYTLKIANLPHPHDLGRVPLKKPKAVIFHNAMKLPS